MQRPQYLFYCAGNTDLVDLFRWYLSSLYSRLWLWVSYLPGKMWTRSHRGS